jgi:hypothetical protein
MKRKVSWRRPRPKIGLQRHRRKKEALVPDPRPFQFEIVNAKLKRFKLPGSDQIPAELIQAGGEILRSKINKLINSIWNTGIII